MKKKLNIGWFCPYALPPLLEHNQVQSIKIMRTANKYLTLGTTKLCRNLSAVYMLLSRGQVDGLVLTNCCNMSQHAGALFKKEFTDIAIYLMDIAIKPGEFFQQLLIDNWKDIYHWIDSLYATQSSSCTQLQQIGGQIESEEKLFECCRFNYRILVEKRNYSVKKIKDDLLTHTFCPLSPDVDKKMYQGISNHHQHAWFDDVCTPLNYLNVE